MTVTHGFVAILAADIAGYSPARQLRRGNTTHLRELRRQLIDRPNEARHVRIVKNRRRWHPDRVRQCGRRCALRDCDGERLGAAQRRRGRIVFQVAGHVRIWPKCEVPTAPENVCCQGQTGRKAAATKPSRPSQSRQLSKAAIGWYRAEGERHPIVRALWSAEFQPMHQS